MSFTCSCAFPQGTTNVQASVTLKKHTLSFLNQVFSFWCQEKFEFSVFASSPPSDSVSSVQSLSHVRLFATPWTAPHQASLSITNSRSSPKPMSIELVMPSNHLILCHPLLLRPQSFPASGSFQMSQLCTSGGQGIGVSESITLCNWTFISITILKISQRLLMMADLMVKSNSFLSSCPPPLATVYNIYLCALFLKYFCPGVSGIWYWPALPSLFSSLSSEVSCLLATSWFCVCFIVWFPPIILSSSEDCIQSHGFNLKPNLEIRSARSLPTHTLYKLF